MFLLKLIIFGFISVSGTFIKRNELDKYTRIATTVDGHPCLGGCSPTTNECVTSWRWTKKPCVLQDEPSPIYYTSQINDKSSKICLSNCGKFGYLYEWCITDADNKWDYCSSHVREDEPTTGKSFIDSYTKEKQRCKSACLKDVKNGYRCTILGLIWHHCARKAISRIPTLPPDYQIGDSAKQNCDAFLTNLVKESFRANVSHFDSENVPDNYLRDIADTVEASVRLAPDSGQFTEASETGSAIKSYTMTNMVLKNGTNVLVPAVIRAFVSNSTIRRNQPLIDVRIMEERNRRKRQAYDDDGYFNWRIVGYELGGSDEDYNFIRQSPNLYESWLQLQRAISKWCGDTGGSVDILIVVFYPDVFTAMPRAIGAAMSFHNPDGSAFVSCKDTLYWNK